MKRAFLGRRWQRRQAGGAQHSTTSTGKRRRRSILQPAASAVGRASVFEIGRRGLGPLWSICPAAADGGEGRA